MLCLFLWAEWLVNKFHCYYINSLPPNYMFSLDLTALSVFRMAFKEMKSYLYGYWFVSCYQDFNLFSLSKTKLFFILCVSVRPLFVMDCFDSEIRYVELSYWFMKISATIRSILLRKSVRTCSYDFFYHLKVNFDDSYHD